jgi:hypothetical protein
MQQLTERCPLVVGIGVGGAVATAAVLRLPRLQDAYDAALVVPVPDDMEKNAGARVAYQMAIDDAEVLAQIQLLEAPLPPLQAGEEALLKNADLMVVPPLAELIASIDPDDMALIKGAAKRLKKKLIASRSGSPPSGESKPDSSPPASAST